MVQSDLSIFALLKSFRLSGFKFISEAPSWLIIICLLAGFLYSWLLYRRDQTFDQVSPFWIRAMMFFRFLSVTVISILLLSPMVKTISREIEKPVIVFVQDNSSSVTATATDSISFRQEYQQKIQSLISSLKEKFDVRFFTVGQSVSEDGEILFDEKETDISKAVPELESRFTGRNVGAVVLATDGIYNKGTNPAYSFNSLRAPVYTIGLGDTTVRKDLLISRINHNKTVFAGNSFPVEITIDARKCAGQQTTLSISKNGNKVFSRSLQIPSSRYNITIPAYLQADQPGTQQYFVELTPVTDEINVRNNRSTFFVEVSNQKQKILILANSPHPDLSAIRSVLESNPNYQADISMISDFNGDIKGNHLVILHQLPSLSNPVSGIISNLRSNSIPVWYILGSQSNVGVINTLESGIQITDNRSNTSEIYAEPSRSFTLFSFDGELLRRISTFPPLTSPFGNYSAGGSVNVFLTQRVGSVKTGMPLMIFKASPDQKTAVLAGEGIWKWRLREFADFQSPDAVTALVSKTVQYLASREKQTPFRLNFKNDYAENEPVLFDAGFYNQTGELVNDGEVQILVQDMNGKSFPFTFSRTERAYSLNAGYLPVGAYRFTATMKTGDKTWSESGTFIIRSLEAEYAETIANHELLRSLSDKTGGSFIMYSELDGLTQQLETRSDIRPVFYEQKKLTDIINLKWVFVLIMLLLAAEWFMRKHQGAY
jgi:hypothetical protein